MIKSQAPILLLIDGNSLVHRAFHAMPRFTAPDGRPTGAVYGFFSILLSVVKQLEPTHLAVAFDVAGPTIRHDQFDGYKAKRVKAPDELYEQIPIITELLKVMNIPQFGVTGYEADDLLATIVTKTKNLKLKTKNLHVVIVTGDRDALQLVGPNVSVFMPKKGIKEGILFDEPTFMKTYGFKPEHMVEYKSLIGDSSDNVPGVPGIGEKTAAILIQKYKSIQNLYKHIDELPAKIKKLLSDHKATVDQAKMLVTMYDNAPVEFVFENAAMHHYDQQTAAEAFQNLGIRSLISRLPSGRQIKQGSLL